MGIKMIFLILGTQKFQLNRLLQCVDSLCEKNCLEEEIFAQTGYSQYAPKHYSYARFLSREEFEQKISESSLIITHSGVGSIITALQHSKPVIVFPRLSKFKEHIDDHQLEIAEAFAKRNYVLCCNEEDDLAELIKTARRHKFNQYVSSTEQIIDIVGKFLEECTAGDLEKRDKH